MPLFLKHSEHDLEWIPFDCSIVEKQVWGKELMCVIMCQKQELGTRKEKERKTNCEKQWKRVQNKWEGTHKCWLLKKGSKKLN